MPYKEGAKRDGLETAAVSISPQPPAEVSSKVLMQGQREITILHGEDRYRLRITNNDKLILTK